MFFNIPPPQDLSGYEEALPGTANRIIKLVEEEVRSEIEHRNDNLKVNRDTLLRQYLVGMCCNCNAGTLLIHCVDESYWRNHSEWIRLDGNPSSIF
jgi:uncharacterized membrane protein